MKRCSNSCDIYCKFPDVNLKESTLRSPSQGEPVKQASQGERINEYQTKDLVAMYYSQLFPDGVENLMVQTLYLKEVPLHTADIFDRMPFWKISKIKCLSLPWITGICRPKGHEPLYL